MHLSHLSSLIFVPWYLYNEYRMISITEPTPLRFTTNANNPKKVRLITPNGEMEKVAKKKRKVVKDKWVCDYCLKASFDDFNEACRHEEECKARKEKESESKIMKPEKLSFTSPSRRRSRRQASMKGTCTQETGFFGKTSKISDPVAKDDPTTAPSAPIFLNASRKTENSKLAANKKKPKPTRKPSTSTHTSAAPIASIFLKASKKVPLDIDNIDNEKKTFIAEQRAAEFMAKRREEAKLDRERNRKREEAQRLRYEQRKRDQEEKVVKEVEQLALEIREAKASKSVKRRRVQDGDIIENPSFLERRKDEDRQLSKLEKVALSAAQYPYTSHLLGDDVQFAKEKVIEESCSSYQRNNQYGVDSVSVSAAEDYSHSLLTRQDSLNEGAPDLLHQHFSSVFQPSANACDESTTASQLWSNTYAMKVIPHDIYGQENKETAEELLDFINGWREHRLQYLKKVEERSAGSKKTVQSSCWYDSESDFMSDSDPDDDDDDLKSVFLLTGPSGSGKTSLVHAAAKNCQCVVLEINSSVKRGGKDLRREIEECTQSHSSLAVLKKEGTLETGGMILDGENEESASLALILIDEVDLLFENDGDSGFWQTLSKLIKKAKCPIILTSTDMPQQLINSMSIKYTASALERPTEMECASKMCQIAKMEQMHWKIRGHNTEVKKRLEMIAKICQCDLRKIMNEMQLFNRGTSKALGQEHTGSLHEKIDKSTELKYDLDPTITRISPDVVQSNEFTATLIHGKHFLNAPFANDLSIEAVVYFGNQKSPASRILDDTTIAAICPPCVIPEHVDSSGLCTHTFQQSLNCRYAPVAVHLVTSKGVIVCSDSNQFKISMGDGSYAATPNITYDFPDIEFGTERKAKSNELIKKFDPETIAALLEKAVAEFGQTSQTESNFIGPPLITRSPSIKTNNDVNKSNDEISALLEAAEYASDAAMIHDAFVNDKVPVLSGAAYGFALEMEETKNSGQQERIGSSMELTKINDWDETSFYFGSPNFNVTRPTRRRDRLLLSRASVEARGKGILLSTSNVSAESFENEDEVTFDELDFFQEQESEEDAFMDSLIPGPLQSLPCQLITHKSSLLEFYSLASCGEGVLVRREREKKMTEFMSANCVIDNLFVKEPNSVDALPTFLALDYIPILRHMAQLEETASKNYERAINIVKDDKQSRGSRRRTRNSPPDRIHYFDEILESTDAYLVYDSKSIGEKLSAMKLRYCSSQTSS